MRFANRVALVTGGTSGIGRAAAVLFAREGASVVVAGRNEERGRQVVAEMEAEGGKAIFVPCDVRLADDCRRAVDEALRAFGRLDVLFNNAGVFYPHTVVDCTEEEWDLTVDISLKGTYLMSRFALPHMIAQGGGSIVNNASGWGLVGGNEAAAYCAAKGGVVLLTKAMAVDHARDGVRVNCVCPGYVATAMQERELEWESAARSLTVEEVKAEYISKTPLGRMQTPDDVARVVAYLASDDAEFMTGAAIDITGGANLT